MKQFVYLLSLSVLWSCASYTSFVDVEHRQDVPQGSKEIIVYSDLASLINIFKEEGILYNYLGGGVETEEILIDEATRAKFTVVEYDGALKLVPYWGITDKVREQMVLWAGYEAASAHTDELTRIIYDKSKTRSKMVFDYAAGLGLRAGDVEFR